MEYYYSPIDCLIIFGGSYCALTLLFFILHITNALPKFLGNLKVKWKGPLLFVIAHPDDECMFFGPSLVEALNQIGKENVYLLCLTNGDYYGQGAIREKELLQSCAEFGMIRDHVKSVKARDLQDGNSEWNMDSVREEILNSVKKLDIKDIVTFDDYGVSGHLNHQSIHKSVCRMKRSSTRNLHKDIKLFSLESVNLFRKYISIFDLVLSVIQCLVKQYTEEIKLKLIMLNLKDIKVPRNAMYRHRSQFVWFRKLYIVFSRYMLINTLNVEGPIIFDRTKIDH